MMMMMMELTAISSEMLNQIVSFCEFLSTTTECWIHLISILSSYKKSLYSEFVKIGNLE